jgi:HPt (histidine-containing phosphotransfer) domain-containing protein
MGEPVDLVNLRSMTDGDVDMEKALFEEFFSSFDSSISILQKSFGDVAAEEWRKEAHALKGISLNLGAMKLGEICKKAQDESSASGDVKGNILNDIKTEYELVRQFLTRLM